MSKTKRFFIFLTLLTFCLALNPRSASACTCAINQSPLDELNNATAVFTGRVTRIDVPRAIDENRHYPVKVTLQVDRVWKGPLANTLNVYTAIDGAACGFDFRAGWHYLVYARGSENELVVNSCSRTSVLSYATEDLALLGEGTQPPNQWGGLTQMGGLTYLGVFLLAAAGAAFFLVVRLKYKRDQQ